MTEKLNCRDFASGYPHLYPTEDNYGNEISAAEFAQFDGFVECRDECYVYVPATHAGYTKDGTKNANHVRMILGRVPTLGDRKFLFVHFGIESPDFHQSQIKGHAIVPYGDYDTFAKDGWLCMHHWEGGVPDGDMEKEANTMIEEHNKWVQDKPFSRTA